MKKSKTINNQDGTWTVFDPNNRTTATIIKIQEFGFLSSNVSTRYRIDVKGKTIASMIENFQTAKSVASNHLAAI
ncbi:hypothetical protein ACQKDD_15305 [Planococcus kocurii]|uniref:hypothetical protein n=1 Tax=Planococcus kocurii TaxID=1374 RepID=UPI003CFE7369